MWPNSGIECTENEHYFIWNSDCTALNCPSDWRCMCGKYSYGERHSRNVIPGEIMKLDDEDPYYSITASGEPAIGKALVDIKKNECIEIHIDRSGFMSSDKIEFFNEFCDVCKKFNLPGHVCWEGIK